MRNLLFFLIVGAVHRSVDAAEDLRRTWTLYHSVDPNLGEKGFSKRGVLTLEPQDNEINLTIANDDDSLAAENVKAMMASGWYQIKLVEDGKKAPVPVKTTVPACQLRRANFR